MISRVLRWGVVLGAWAVVAAALVVAVPALAGATPSVAHAGAQAVLPQLGLAASVALLVAVATRGRALAVGAAVAALACLAPALALSWSPTRAPAGTTPPAEPLSIYVHNQRYDNLTPLDAAEQALGSGADVLVLLELTPAMVGDLADRGVDRAYPHQLLDPADDPYGAGIYSRLPLGDAEVARVGTLRLPSATVALGPGVDLGLVAVHTAAPVDPARLATWERELGALADLVREGHGPTAWVGDFNASRWHPPFARVLDAGVADAHEATGQGFSRSWPMPRGWARWLGPQTRLDHALVRDVAVVGVRDLGGAGSDHAAFLLELAPVARGPQG